MAKQDKDAIFNSFLADLKAINPAVEEIFKDEKVSAKLREGVLARSEFSSSMDALKADREQMEAFVAQEKTKVEGWQSYTEKALRDAATLSDELKTYRETYGELDAPDQRKVAKQAGLSVEEFQKRMNDEINKHDVAALKFVDDLTDLKIEHRDRFKEKLDTAALYKIAGEQNVPLSVAYNLYTADRVEEKRKTDFDDAIKQAKKEGAAEALSQHNLPMLPSQSEYVHTLDVKQPLTNSTDRIAAAVKDFYSNRS